MSLAHGFSNDLNQYKQNEISTASPGQLIIMMYDGAIRFIQNASDNMTPRKYDVVNQNILKAQDIVTELMLALDMQNGGKVAENLFSLYAYLKKRLIEANMQKDTEILSEVKRHLGELRTAWVEANKSMSSAPAGQPRPAESSFSIEG